MDKALVFGTRDCGFDPHRNLSILGGVAQMVERSLCMREVAGSMPAISTFYFKFGWCSWLSRLPYTQKVAGSNPASNFIYIICSIVHII